MGEMDDLLKAKMERLKHQLIPESKPKQEEPIVPSVEFKQALHDKVKAMKEDETLGLDAYEARKLKALKESEVQKDKPKNVPKRRNLWGEIEEIK